MTMFRACFNRERSLAAKPLSHFTLTRIELAIRTTCIYRKENGRWLQIHHHGSIEDPVLLARYQDAVLAGSALTRD